MTASVTIDSPPRDEKTVGARAATWGPHSTGRRGSGREGGREHARSLPLHSRDLIQTPRRVTENSTAQRFRSKLRCPVYHEQSS
eukprot:6208869-Pleurochrysis_carterae.AAC.8